jgi:hypothetical protein
MRILGISGSLRRDSYNTALLRHAGELFEAEGAQFELYSGLRELPPFDEDEEVNPPETVERLRVAIGEADGVIFVIPEYNRRSRCSQERARLGVTTDSDEHNSQQTSSSHRRKHRGLRRGLGTS